MLYKFNYFLLGLGILLLIPGVVGAFGASSWNPEAVLFVGTYAKEWLALVSLVSLTPAILWATYGTLRTYRRFGTIWGLVATFMLLVVVVNAGFWSAAFYGSEAARQKYRYGQVVWVGHNALLFGHGFWKLADGYWQHQTLIRLDDGSIYRGPTLELVSDLKRTGADNIWGSWCYTGNYPYIKKDLITGEVNPWPSYVSYNKHPGKTIPIWLGASFLRVGWEDERYLSEPVVPLELDVDTLSLRYVSRNKLERIWSYFRRQIKGMPEADSVSWRPLAPDTVYSIPRDLYQTLTIEKRREVRKWEKEASLMNARVGIAHYWIRGRKIPLYVQVPASIHRPDSTSFEVPGLLARYPFSDDEESDRREARTVGPPVATLISTLSAGQSNGR